MRTDLYWFSQTQFEINPSFSFPSLPIEIMSLFQQFTLCPTLAMSRVIVATAFGCLKAR